MGGIIDNLQVEQKNAGDRLSIARIQKRESL